MIKIERMKEEHLDELSEIEKESFSEPWSKESLRDELDNKNAYFIVAKQDEKVVAYVGLYNICSEGYITNIVVREDYRGKSIGSELMLNILKFAQDNKLKFLTLEVRKSNKLAVKFYNKFKFDSEGVRKNFYRRPREDAIIMTRKFKDDVLC